MRTAFARYPELDKTPIDAPAPAEPIVGYRTRLKWVVGADGSIGLYARNEDHVVVDIPGCRVAPEPALEVAEKLRTLFAVSPKDAPKTILPALRGGSLRGLDVRVTDADEVLVTLLVAGPATPDEEKRAAALVMERAPRVRGVAIGVQGKGPQLLGGAPRSIGGVATLPDRIGEARVLAAPGSFVQAHRGQAARIVTLLRAVVDDARVAGKKPRVLDLYGGSGGFGLALAAHGADVLVVDSFAAATRLATDAARAQKLSLEGRAGDAAEVLAALVADDARFDAIVVNPPRRGLAPDVRAAIAALAPARVAYVSCDPETLARDLAHLARLGFAPKTVSPVDMIPLTDEIEDVAVLVRHAAPKPRLLRQSADWVIVEKGAHEATLPSGEGSSVLGRLRSDEALREAIAIVRLEVGTSGAVVLARSKAVEARVRERLASGSVKFLALVRGVTSKKGSIGHALREGGELVAARTRYHRLKVVRGHSLVAVTLDGEGRAQQLRRHFAAIGHPVLGDERHGDAASNRHFLEKYALDRPFVHASRVEIEGVTTEAPLAGDLAAVLDRLGASEVSKDS